MDFADLRFSFWSPFGFSGCERWFDGLPGAPLPRHPDGSALRPHPVGRGGHAALRHLQALAAAPDGPDAGPGQDRERCARLVIAMCRGSVFDRNTCSARRSGNAGDGAAAVGALLPQTDAAAGGAGPQQRPAPPQPMAGGHPTPGPASAHGRHAQGLGRQVSTTLKCPYFKTLWTSLERRTRRVHRVGRGWSALIGRRLTECFDVQGTVAGQCDGAAVVAVDSALRPLVRRHVHHRLRHRPGRPPLGQRPRRPALRRGRSRCPPHCHRWEQSVTILLGFS